MKKILAVLLMILSFCIPYIGIYVERNVLFAPAEMALHVMVFMLLTIFSIIFGIVNIIKQFEL